MNTPSMKAKILPLLHFARDEEEKFVSTLSDSERDAVGTAESWAARDFLVNITLWKKLQTQKLATAVRGDEPPVWRDMELVHKLNGDAFTRSQGLSFEEVQAEGAVVFAAFIAQVESMSEEELADPSRYGWQEGEPLWQETLGNGLWHPLSQLTTYHLQRNDRAVALHLQDSLLHEARRATLPPETLGVALYNYACFAATSGWPERALQILPEALHLRPSLLEWSRRDPDFDSVRGDPAFEAIFRDSTLLAKVPASDLIDPRELYERSTSDAGVSQPLVIDVRGPGEYSAGHVQGALNIPLGQLAKNLKQIPAGQLVATYCNMHHRGESRGERAALLLRQQGYQACAIDGGYPAWKEEGLPVIEAAPAE
jgi:rhodanese-related sulfurtransferase